MSHQLATKATSVSTIPQPIGSQNAPTLRIVNRTQKDFVWVVTVLCSRLYKDVLPDFFAAAQRAFASADNFFRIAGLIALRAVTFFADAEVFFGAATLFCFAHRAFCAADILARADALMVRLPIEAFEGRPSRVLDPSSAAIA